MKTEPKLIVLYGFAGSGKTTLAGKYIDEHPLALSIEEDGIIDMMGQWRKFESEARALVFEHTKFIVKNQLAAGYNVIIPHLLTDSARADTFKAIAEEGGYSWHEVYLDAEKEVAIARLLERGVWGEKGSPALAEEDRPEIEDLFDRMEREMSKRSGIISIEVDRGDILGTYQKFLKAVSE